MIFLSEKQDNIKVEEQVHIDFWHITRYVIINSRYDDPNIQDRSET